MKFWYRRAEKPPLGEALKALDKAKGKPSESERLPVEPFPLTPAARAALKADESQRRLF